MTCLNELLAYVTEFFSQREVNKLLRGFMFIEKLIFPVLPNKSN